MQKKVRILIKCGCGCGNKIENYDNRGRPRKYIKNHYKSTYWAGKKFTKSHIKKIKIARLIQEKTQGSPAWKGGRSKMLNGYMRIWKVNQGKYLLEHRLVMETVLGRKLSKKEVIHHKNHIRHDNRPQNLQLYPSHSVHMKEERYEKT